MAEIVFDDEVQVAQQQPAALSAPQAASIRRPEVVFEDSGIPPGMKEAVIKSGQVGQQRFQSQDPLVQQADFYLGKDSARKFQKYVAGNYEPLPDEDFTDKERQFLVDYENKRGRKVLGGIIKYGGPLAAQFFPGGQVIAGEMAYPAIANIVGQMVSPDKFSVSEAAAELVPGVSLSKKAAAPGIRSFLTTAETGVAQQSSLGKQVVKEFGAGAGTSLVKSGIEAMGGEITGGDVIQNAVLGGLLYPSISTSGRALSAVAKGGLSASKIAGEFQRPFTQQFLAERSAEIQERLGGGAGIDPALSDLLANTLYSPEFSGTGAEAVQNWNDRIKQFIGESVVNGRRSGLSGDELTRGIVEELKQFSGKPDIDLNLVDAIVRKSDELTEQAKSNVDQFLNSKNSELVGLARRAEGELQVESQNLKNQIRDLTVQKNNLPTTNQADREQLTNQIAEKTRQIQQIEEGFDSRFPAGKPISAFEAKTEVGKIGKKEVKQFDDIQEKGFGGIRPELKRTTVQIETGKDKDGNPIFETKNLEDLRKIRSQIYRLFDFNAAVQQGFFESWDRLNKINDQITQAFDQNPALRDALAAQNKSYAEGIKRFKGAYVDKVLRDIGEAGGTTDAIEALTGKKGPIAMSALKDMAGERWTSEVKPILSDYIYNQIRGEKPTDFLNTLIEAKGARGKLSKEVANEFFPSIAEIQDVAKTYKSLIDEQAALTANSKELNKQHDQLIKDVDAGISGSEKLLAANEKAIKANETQLQKVLINQKDDTAKRLAELKAAVLDNKNIRFDDDEIKTILANPNAKDLVKNLSDYVYQVSQKQSEFQDALARSLKSGRMEGTPTPGDIVDFLKQSTDTLSSRNRSRKFMDIVTANRPELYGDVQNIIVGRIVEDALSKDGKMIDAAKMKQLVAGGTSPGPYNAMVTAAFGENGVNKISKIADQLSDLTADKETILQKTVLPFIVGSTVATYFGGGPLTAVGAGGLAISQRRAAMSIAKNVGAATVGKILLNPTYISTVSKPIDSLTKTQLDTFTRQWPKILTLEYERMKMHDENQKLEERQMRESQLQMRRRD